MVAHRDSVPAALPPGPGAEHADGADLIGAAGIGPAKLLRGLERFVEGGAVDDIEAQELLLGLGEGPVDDQRRLLFLRNVVAAVVGSRRATGPRRPCLASFSCTTSSLAMTASSSALVQAPTTSSEW